MEEHIKKYSAFNNVELKESLIYESGESYDKQESFYNSSMFYFLTLFTIFIYFLIALILYLYK